MLGMKEVNQLQKAGKDSQLHLSTNFGHEI